MPPRPCRFKPGDMVYFKPGIGPSLQGHLVEIVEYEPPHPIRDGLHHNGLYIVRFDDDYTPDQAFGAAWFTKEFVPRVPEPTNLKEHLDYIGWKDYEEIANAYKKKGMGAALACMCEEYVEELRGNIESWIKNVPKLTQEEIESKIIGTRILDITENPTKNNNLSSDRR